MGNPTYLCELLFFSLIAFFLQKNYRLKLFRNQKHYLIFFFVIALIGWIWDYTSVWLHIWEFPMQGTIGIRIGILPIEEYLFFLVVPYFGIALYKTIEKKLKN